MLVVMLGLLSACAGGLPTGRPLRPMPGAGSGESAQAMAATAAPTAATLTVEPSPTPTAIASPTATLVPTETPIETATPVSTATPTAAPPTARATLTPTRTATSPPKAAARAAVVTTPQVTIPANWPVYTDNRLGYSLAMPRAWLKFDLRSDGFQSLFNMLGPGASQFQTQLQDLLNTPTGEYIGMVAVEPDIMQMFAQYPFPTIANVTVAPLLDGITPEQVQTAVEAGADLYPSVTLVSSQSTIINNLPGVRATFAGDLADLGYPVKIQVEQVGLVAKGNLYILTLVVRQEVAARRAATLEQIIGTFRPQ